MEVDAMPYYLAGGLAADKAVVCGEVSPLRRWSVPFKYIRLGRSPADYLNLEELSQHSDPNNVALSGTCVDTGRACSLPAPPPSSPRRQLPVKMWVLPVKAASHLPWSLLRKDDILNSDLKIDSMLDLCSLASKSYGDSLSCDSKSTVVEDGDLYQASLLEERVLSPLKADIGGGEACPIIGGDEARTGIGGGETCRKVGGGETCRTVGGGETCRTVGGGETCRTVGGGKGCPLIGDGEAGAGARPPTPMLNEVDGLEQGKVVKESFLATVVSHLEGADVTTKRKKLRDRANKLDSISEALDEKMLLELSDCGSDCSEKDGGVKENGCCVEDEDKKTDGRKLDDYRPRNVASFVMEEERAEGAFLETIVEESSCPDEDGDAFSTQLMHEQDTLPGRDGVGKVLQTLGAAKVENESLIVECKPQLTKSCGSKLDRETCVALEPNEYGSLPKIDDKELNQKETRCIEREETFLMTKHNKDEDMSVGEKLRTENKPLTEEGTKPCLSDCKVELGQIPLCEDTEKSGILETDKRKCSVQDQGGKVDDDREEIEKRKANVQKHDEDVAESEDKLEDNGEKFDTLEGKVQDIGKKVDKAEGKFGDNDKKVDEIKGKVEHNVEEVERSNGEDKDNCKRVEKSENKVEVNGEEFGNSDCISENVDDEVKKIDDRVAGNCEAIDESEGTWSQTATEVFSWTSCPVCLGVVNQETLASIRRRQRSGSSVDGQACNLHRAERPTFTTDVLQESGLHPAKKMMCGGKGLLTAETQGSNTQECQNSCAVVLEERRDAKVVAKRIETKEIEEKGGTKVMEERRDTKVVEERRDTGFSNLLCVLKQKVEEHYNACVAGLGAQEKENSEVSEVEVSGGIRKILPRNTAVKALGGLEFNPDLPAVRERPMGVVDVHFKETVHRDDTIGDEFTHSDAEKLAEVAVGEKLPVVLPCGQTRIRRSSMESEVWERQAMDNLARSSLMPFLLTHPDLEKVKATRLRNMKTRVIILSSPRVEVFPRATVKLSKINTLHKAGPTELHPASPPRGPALDRRQRAASQPKRGLRRKMSTPGVDLSQKSVVGRGKIGGSARGRERRAGVGRSRDVLVNKAEVNKSRDKSENKQKSRDLWPTKDMPRRAEHQASSVVAPRADRQKVMRQKDYGHRPVDVYSISRNKIDTNLNKASEDLGNTGARFRRVVLTKDTTYKPQTVKAQELQENLRNELVLQAKAKRKLMTLSRKRYKIETEEELRKKREQSNILLRALKGYHHLDVGHKAGPWQDLPLQKSHQLHNYLEDGVRTVELSDHVSVSTMTTFSELSGTRELTMDDAAHMWRSERHSWEQRGFDVMPNKVRRESAVDKAILVSEVAEVSQGEQTDVSSELESDGSHKSQREAQTEGVAKDGGVAKTEGVAKDGAQSEPHADSADTDDQKGAKKVRKRKLSKSQLSPGLAEIAQAKKKRQSAESTSSTSSLKRVLRGSASGKRFVSDSDVGAHVVLESYKSGRKVSKMLGEDAKTIGVEIREGETSSGGPPQKDAQPEAAKEGSTQDTDDRQAPEFLSGDGEKRLCGSCQRDSHSSNISDMSMLCGFCGGEREYSMRLPRFSIRPCSINCPCEWMMYTGGRTSVHGEPCGRKQPVTSSAVTGAAPPKLGQGVTVAVQVVDGKDAVDEASIAIPTIVVISHGATSTDAGDVTTQKRAAGSPGPASDGGAGSDKTAGYGGVQRRNDQRAFTGRENRKPGVFPGKYVAAKRNERGVQCGSDNIRLLLEDSAAPTSVVVSVENQPISPGESGVQADANATSAIVKRGEEKAVKEGKKHDGAEAKGPSLKLKKEDGKATASGEDSKMAAICGDVATRPCYNTAPTGGYRSWLRACLSPRRPCMFSEVHQLPPTSNKPCECLEDKENQPISGKPSVFNKDNEYSVLGKPSVFNKDKENQPVSGKPSVFNKDNEQQPVSVKPSMFSREYERQPVTGKPSVFNKDKEYQPVTGKPSVFNKDNEHPVSGKPSVFNKDKEYQPVTGKPSVFNKDNEHPVSGKPSVFNKDNEHPVSGKPSVFNKDKEYQPVTGKPSMFNKDEEYQPVAGKPSVFNKDKEYQPVTGKPSVFNKDNEHPVSGKPSVFNKDKEYQPVVGKPSVFIKDNEHPVSGKPSVFIKDNEHPVSGKPSVFNKDNENPVLGKPSVFSKDIEHPVLGKPSVFSKDNEHPVLGKPSVFSKDNEHPVLGKPSVINKENERQPATGKPGMFSKDTEHQPVSERPCPDHVREPVAHSQVRSPVFRWKSEFMSSLNSDCVSKFCDPLMTRLKLKKRVSFAYPLPAYFESCCGDVLRNGYESRRPSPARSDPWSCSASRGVCPPPVTSYMQRISTDAGLRGAAGSYVNTCSAFTHSMFKSPTTRSTDCEAQGNRESLPSENQASGKGSTAPGHKITRGTAAHRRSSSSPGRKKPACSPCQNKLACSSCQNKSECSSCQNKSECSSCQKKLFCSPCQNKLSCSPCLIKPKCKPCQHMCCSPCRNSKCCSALCKKRNTEPSCLNDEAKEITNQHREAVASAPNGESGNISYSHSPSSSLPVHTESLWSNRPCGDVTLSRYSRPAKRRVRFDTSAGSFHDSLLISPRRRGLTACDVSPRHYRHTSPPRGGGREMWSRRFGGAYKLSALHTSNFSCQRQTTYQSHVTSKPDGLAHTSLTKLSDDLLGFSSHRLFTNSKRKL